MTRSARRQRQQAEIEAAATSGNASRALALAAEHLSEFADDEVVLAVVAALCPADAR